MAIFRNQNDGRFVVLRPLHAFGRRPTACQTVVNAPDVSQVHAVVRWNRYAWEIVDQSRNGTSLDGAALHAGRWTALTAGAQIRIGAGDRSAWTVVDLAPPVTCLFPSDGRGRTVVLNPCGNLLPDAQQPEANLFFHAGRWLLEHSDDVEYLSDGAQVRTSDGQWEFVLCDDIDSTSETALTTASPPLPDVVLRFDISQNEEHTRLNLVVEGRQVPLGERIHHYTLVTLARMRQRDARRGIVPQSQGWIGLDDLARMLGVEPSYVNIQIFRAKHQILGALPPGLAAPPLVERRRGDLRFGGFCVEMEGGTPGV